APTPHPIALKTPAPKIRGIPLVFERQYTSRKSAKVVAPAVEYAVTTALPDRWRVTAMKIASVIPCTTKNIMAAMMPSDVDTRAGGDAAGSSRYGSSSRAFCHSASESNPLSTITTIFCHHSLAKIAYVYSPANI